jgi:trehalose/maltose hydrolase-like predicted phosphorylase
LTLANVSTSKSDQSQSVSKSALRFLDIDPWVIRECGFHPERTGAAESIFALANEVTGVRGYFEEGYSGSTTPGVSFNGLFEVFIKAAQALGVDPSEFLV